MSKFFPGCPVRILYSYGWPELKGSTGRIVDAGDITHGPWAGNPGWRVAPDIWGTYHAPRPGTHGASNFCPTESQLEPVIPQGAAPSELTFTELMDRCKAGEVECV
jgi:hypothetical protein